VASAAVIANKLNILLFFIFMVKGLQQRAADAMGCYPYLDEPDSLTGATGRRGIGRDFRVDDGARVLKCRRDGRAPNFN
jgi:hypothetical protein